MYIFTFLFMNKKLGFDHCDSLLVIKEANRNKRVANLPLLK